MRARGEHWTVLHTSPGLDCRSITLLPEAGGVRARTLLEPFDRITPVESSFRARLVHARRWAHVVRRQLSDMRPAGGLRSAPAPTVRLLEWQMEPALAAMRYGVARILVADAVGLGKTIQAGILITELCAQSASSRILVLAPAGLRQQWRSELVHHFGADPVDADAAWLAAASRDWPADVNPWALPGVYVCSHDFVKRPEVLRPIEDVTWDLLVLDEAHAAALHTHRRAAADAIARRSRHVLLLTATPHADQPEQFDALCRLGQLDVNDRVMLFRRVGTDIAPSLPRRTVPVAIQPSPAERHMLQLIDAYTGRVWVEARGRDDHLARLVSIVLRKRALSSAGSLLVSLRRRLELLSGIPEPQHEQLPLPLGDEDPLDDETPAAVLGAHGLADARRERRWLASIAEAAHLASRHETKTHALVRLVRRLQESAIIFTEYRDTLIRLQRALSQAGVPALVMHGGLGSSARSEVQATFNAGRHVLLATDAAAEGLNLHTCCRLVVHFELPWSVSRLEQRAGRVDRFGQTRRVHEILLIAADTAERFVLAPLARKAIHARSRGSAGSLADALSESRVAETILGNRPIEDTPPRTNKAPFGAMTIAPPAGLPSEAAEEARRLAELRECSARSGRRTSTAEPVVVTSLDRRKSTLPIGFTFLHRITIRSRTGDVICTVPAVITSPHTSSRARTAAQRLRLAALGPPDDEIVRALIHVTAAAVHRAARHESGLQTARRSRDEAIRRARSSVARQLVQASLFDRRAIREAASRSRAHALLDDNGRLEPTFSGHLVTSVEVELFAVIHVFERKRR